MFHTWIVNLAGFAKKHWPLFLGLIFGIAVFSLKILGFQFEMMPGSLADSRFNMYLLELGYQYVFCGLEWYWESPFMWPEHQVITYSDNLLGNVPIYGFFRMLSADRELAFQLWIMAVFALNFLAAYVAVFRMLGCAMSAFLGAFVFAFSIAILGQIFHAQTFPRFPIPLVFLGLFEFHRQKKVSWLVFAMAMVVWQIYCGIYLGLMLIIPVILYVSVFIVSDFWGWFYALRQKKAMISLFVGGGFLAYALWWLMSPYKDRAKEGGLRAYSFVFERIPSWKSYLMAPESSSLWHKSTSVLAEGIPAIWNQQLFQGLLGTIGFLFLIVVIGKTCFSFFKSKKVDFQNGHLAIAVAGVGTMLFFLKIGDFSLYKLIYGLPGFGSMRALARIINILLLFSGFGLAALFFRYKLRLKKWAVPVFFLLFGLLVGDNWFNQRFPKFPKMESKTRVDAIVAKGQEMSFPKGGVFSYEPGSIEGEQGAWLNIDGMLAAQDLGMKSINGYSADSPPVFWMFWKVPNAANRGLWLDYRKAHSDSVYVVQ